MGFFRKRIVLSVEMKYGAHFMWVLFMCLSQSREVDRFKRGPAGAWTAGRPDPHRLPGYYSATGSVSTESSECRSRQAAGLNLFIELSVWCDTLRRKSIDCAYHQDPLLYCREGCRSTRIISRREFFYTGQITCLHCWLNDCVLFEQ